MFKFGHRFRLGENTSNDTMVDINFKLIKKNVFRKVVGTNDTK